MEHDNENKPRIRCCKSLQKVSHIITFPTVRKECTEIMVISLF